MPPISLPESGASRTVLSADQFKTKRQFKESILDTLRESRGFRELVITDIPQGWERFLWEVEEALPATRKTYDPTSATLRVTIRPTWAHNVAMGWLSDSKTDWVLSGAMNQAEKRLVQLAGNTSKLLLLNLIATWLILAALSFQNGPYRGLRKEPDAMFHVPSQTLPTLTVEVGWSESYDDLCGDMNRLLVGGNGDIKIVIIIKWTKERNGHISGILELYRIDRQGIPRLEQTEVIFPMPAGDPPQPLNIRRGELCQVSCGYYDDNHHGLRHGYLARAPRRGS